MNLRHHLMLAAIAGITFSNPVAAQNIGPSTTTEPYVLPTIAGVSTTSILTTGDSVGGYRMVGIPDGLGAWEQDRGHGGDNRGANSRHGDDDDDDDDNNGKGRPFNLVMTHELGKASGVVRAHGSTGAFVSRWSIQPLSLKVLTGRDHLTVPGDVFTWSGATYTAGTTAFDRLCSADLPHEDAFSWRGRFGTENRIFLSGELACQRERAGRYRET